MEKNPSSPGEAPLQKELRSLGHFFRDDIPDETKGAIIHRLLTDLGVREMFSSDLVTQAPGPFDVASHIPGHIWAAKRGYGVPAYDLGWIFWLGQDLDEVLCALQDEFDGALQCKRNYYVDPDSKEVIAEVLQNVKKYTTTLKATDRTKSVPELVELNPMPDVFQFGSGTRFSFFLYFLPFHNDGEEVAQTYARRKAFFEQLSQFIPKADDPIAQESESTSDQAPVEKQDTFLEAVIHGDIIATDENFDQFIAAVLDVLAIRSGIDKNRDSKANFQLERSAMLLAFNIRDKSITRPKHVEEAVDYILTLARKNNFPTLLSSSLYALAMIGKLGNQEALEYVQLRLAAGLPKYLENTELWIEEMLDNN